MLSIINQPTKISPIFDNFKRQFYTSRAYVGRGRPGGEVGRSGK